jgi:tripartite-type tricarboxylate transporter receptor subunit TctC
MAVMVAALAPACAGAQDWPNRLVRIVVPAAPGGSSDAAARLVTNHFQAVFRQPFIIENKPGNGNALGAAMVAQAEPDGYTLLSSNSASNLTVPLIAKNAGYDPVADFSHIVMLTSLRRPIAAAWAISAANISSASPASPCSTCLIAAALRRWRTSLPDTCR